jgi:hypothetical protein
MRRGHLCAYDQAVYDCLAGHACVRGDSWTNGLHLVDWYDEAQAHWVAQLEHWRACKVHRQCSVRCWMIWMGFFAIYAAPDAPQVAWVTGKRVAA